MFGSLNTRGNLIFDLESPIGFETFTWKLLRFAQEDLHLSIRTFADRRSVGGIAVRTFDAFVAFAGMQLSQALLVEVVSSTTR